MMMKLVYSMILTRFVMGLVSACFFFFLFSYSIFNPINLGRQVNNLQPFNTFENRANNNNNNNNNKKKRIFRFTVCASIIQSIYLSGYVI